jgi:hypothetical protein
MGNKPQTRPGTSRRTAGALETGDDAERFEERPGKPAKHEPVGQPE